jgi:hypothetical protein
MKPNNNFDFNVAELSIVEDAMRYRLRRLTSRRATVMKESSSLHCSVKYTTRKYFTRPRLGLSEAAKRFARKR